MRAGLFASGGSLLKRQAMCAQVDTLALQLRQRAFFPFYSSVRKMPKAQKI